MLKGATYQELCDNFRWEIPEYYNVGVDVCDKWAAADGDRTALIFADEDGTEGRYTFRELKRQSNRLANGLRALGVEREDRVGILLPQCPETLISHIAAYKLGAIALPLLTLFGPMAIEYRLIDSGAKCVITNAENLPKLMEIRKNLPELRVIISIDGGAGQAAGQGGEESVLDYHEVAGKGSEDFAPVLTRPSDPALIIYTSGTTGQPKGTLHGHQLLLGILPGFEFYHNLFPKPGDLLYTPLDWAYIGGSYDALFPSLHHGVPVLGFRPRKFDPEKAFAVMAKYQVRNLMTVPTVLRIMMNTVKNPSRRYGVRLRSITAGGETLGDELYEWCPRELGAQINEQYGQTECDLVVGFCSEVMPIERGFIGKAVPGHRVDIMDREGNIAGPGELGEIVVKAPDPVMFLGYWNNPEGTRKKFSGEWLKTGDFGIKDETGCFRFTGREDDLIESGGFRIGPGEIEDCLMDHPAVALVCVLGAPDPVKGHVVKAFIVPREAFAPDEALEADIRSHVKTRLEAHAAPKLIEFLKEMPMTKTGKILKSELRRRIAEGA